MIRRSATNELASVAGRGPSAPRVARSARPACRCPASPPGAATRRSCDSHSGHTAEPTRRCRPSVALRPHGPAGSCAASSDAAREPHRHGARKPTARLERARCRRGDARGLVVSPGSLLQDQLVQRQVRDGTAKPAVLRLKFLQAPYLVALQAAELLAPAVIRHLAHPDRADRLRYALTL